MISRLVALAAAALATTAAQSQDAASAPQPTLLAKAEDCMRAYGRRFAPTSALPQDVADAGLDACSPERWRAADQRAGGSGASIAFEAQAKSLRQIAIRALLEARFPAKK